MSGPGLGSGPTPGPGEANGLPDPQELPLDVYQTDRGLWNPDYGELDPPQGWELLAAGDAFLTRTVKAAGAFWTAWSPRGRNRPHRRRLGLYAPAEAIAKAEAAAARSSISREHQRELGARQRERAEARYRDELASAIVEFLAFAPAHRALAEGIAQAAAALASQVGSGRVGRARTLSLPERAALAARAWIRHHHTDYEDHLMAALYGDGLEEGDVPDAGLFDGVAGDVRDVKREAHRAVDDFLAEHRAC